MEVPDELSNADRSTLRRTIREAIAAVETAAGAVEDTERAVQKAQDKADSLGAHGGRG